MKAKRGSLLAVAILVTSIVVMLAAIISSSALLNLNNSRKISGKKESRYVAYAGLQDAMARLMGDEGEFFKDQWPYEFSEPMPGDERLSYRVEMWCNVLTSSGADPTAGRTIAGTEVEVPPGAVYLTAEGTRQDGETVKIVSAMAGLAIKNKAVFDQAAFGDLFLAMKSATYTDSYDSGIGYVPSSSGPPASGDTPMEGDIGGAGYIEVAGGSVVSGDTLLSPVQRLCSLFEVNSPEGDDNPTVDDESGDVLGEITEDSEQVIIPRFQAPFATSDAVADLNVADLPDPPAPPPPSGGGRGGPPPPPPPPPAPRLDPNQAFKNLHIPPGESVKLVSGSYYVSEAFTSDGGRIEVDASSGPVILYVGYRMDLNNTDILASRPRDLQIYFTDELPESVLAGLPIDPETGLPMMEVPEGARGSTAGDATTDGTATGSADSGGASGTPSVRPEIGSEFTARNSRLTCVAAGKALNANVEGGEVFGAVSGQMVQMKSGFVHYDQTLKGMPLGGASEWLLEGVHEKTR